MEASETKTKGSPNKMLNENKPLNEGEFTKEPKNKTQEEKPLNKGTRIKKKEEEVAIFILVPFALFVTATISVKDRNFSSLASMMALRGKRSNSTDFNSY